MQLSPPPRSTQNNEVKPIQFCPVYRIRAVQDSFGCAARDADELRLPGNIDRLVENKGFGDREVSEIPSTVYYLYIELSRLFSLLLLLMSTQTERDAQMLAMLLQEAQRRELFVEPRSLGEILFCNTHVQMSSCALHFILIKAARRTVVNDFRCTMRCFLVLY